MKIAQSNDNNSIGILDRILEFVVPKEKNIISLLPYKKILEDGTLLTNDNKFQAFFKVKTTDLTSISEDGFYRMVNKFTYLNRVYLEPYKIYSLTYPTETIEQSIYWKSRIEDCKRALINNEYPHKEQYLKWNLKLAYDNYERSELVTTLPELLFIIAVYGDTQKELNNHAEVIRQVGGKELNLQRLSGEELKKVVRKLMNPNSNL